MAYPASVHLWTAAAAAAFAAGLWVAARAGTAIFGSAVFWLAYAPPLALVLVARGAAVRYPLTAAVCGSLVFVWSLAMAYAVPFSIDLVALALHAVAAGCCVAAALPRKEGVHAPQ